MSGNSLHTHYIRDVIADQRDTLKHKTLTHTTFTGTGLPAADLSGSIVADTGYLNMFHAGIILDGPSQVSAIRTTFYDTSGVPTGAEPELFTFISFTQKISGITQGFTENDFHFPEKGMRFDNGIGFTTQVVIGTPTIAQVDALFTYVNEGDDYP